MYISLLLYLLYNLLIYNYLYTYLYSIYIQYFYLNLTLLFSTPPDTKVNAMQYGNTTCLLQFKKSIFISFKSAPLLPTRLRLVMGEITSRRPRDYGSSLVSPLIHFFQHKGPETQSFFSPFFVSLRLCGEFNMSALCLYVELNLSISVSLCLCGEITFFGIKNTRKKLRKSLVVSDIFRTFVSS